jgi:succinate dehydrogenase / fumarate reductase membrane anchor subunit
MSQTRWWLLSLGAAALIVVLLGAHFAVMHYSPVFYGQTTEAARSFDSLVTRGRDTAQLVVYLLLLAAALYHGLYGLRGIVLELPGARPWTRVVNGALLAAGLAFFGYGAYVTWWTFTLVR